MKIFDRILLACGIIVAIGAAQNAFALWDLSEISGKIVEATTAPLLQVTAANRLSAQFRKADRHLPTSPTQSISFRAPDATAKFRQTIAEMNRGDDQAFVRRGLPDHLQQTSKSPSSISRTGRTTR